MSESGDHGTAPAEVQWDERGLAPAVVSDAQSGAVLMLGWMNAEALRQTRESGLVHFYSRSRQTQWQKGETSGNTLRVREVRLDCDSDAILVVAEPAGPTCHTGARSCFFRRGAEGGDRADRAGQADRAEPADGADWAEDDGPAGAPAAVVDRLEQILESRKTADPGTSYTASLLQGGIDRVIGKIDEEAKELVDELRSAAHDKIVHESADLLFHVLVGLVARGVSAGEVWRELERRFGVSGHAEKAART